MAKPSKYPKFPGVIDRPKASGLKYYYRFKDGSEKQLPDDMESEAFAFAYEACRQLNLGEVKPKAKEKTFADLWLAYQASEYYQNLDSALTKTNHRRYAMAFLAAPLKDGGKATFAEVPVKSPEEELLPLIRRYIKTAKSDLPYRTACLLRRMYEVAIEKEWCLRNLGNDLQVAKPKSKGGRQEWPVERLAQFERFHQSNVLALTTYGLARFLGNRRGDVALLAWEQLKVVHETVGGVVSEEWYFDFRQRKNRNRTGGAEMYLPVPAVLRALLSTPEMVASRLQGGAIIKSEHGTGYAIGSMGNRFADWCREAGIPKGYSLHGLRANFADELFGAGADLQTIQLMCGHGDPNTTAIYLKKNQKRNAELAAQKAKAIRENKANQEAQILQFKRSQKA